jgi:hypothetical protein
VKGWHARVPASLTTKGRAHTAAISLSARSEADAVSLGHPGVYEVWQIPDQLPLRTLTVTIDPVANGRVANVVAAAGLAGAVGLGGLDVGGGLVVRASAGERVGDCRDVNDNGGVVLRVGVAV